MDPLRNTLSTAAVHHSPLRSSPDQQSNRKPGIQMQRNKGVLHKTAVCLFLITGGVFAQINPPRPKFEVAVVKLNKSGTDEQSGGILPGGQFSVTNISMIQLLQFAYGVDENAISGIPAWFRSDRFDIVGKGPTNTSDATLRLMLQSLLATEFKLAVRQEQKPQDGFALVAANGGPKLQKSASPPATGSVAANGQDDPNERCKRTEKSTGIQADCTSISMVELAKRLRSLAPAYIDRPVVDLTGVSGTYDLKLQWTGRAQIDAAGGLTIFDALTKQLGLKLEQWKIPLPGIAIEHVERLSGN
jgi:uncharacterized protein (TIGR03435 family)